MTYDSQANIKKRKERTDKRKKEARRERFVMHSMAAVVARDGIYSERGMTEVIISLADAVLKALDESEEK